MGAHTVQRRTVW